MEKDYSKLYRLYEKEWWWFVGRHDLISRILDGGKVLEIGCSSGENSKMVRDGVYYGLDVSEEGVRAGDRNKRLVVGDGCGLPFVDGSFDTVLFLDVLEHLEDDYKAVNEAYRVLKRGGMIIVLVPAFEFLWDTHDDLNEHKRRYSKAGLCGVLGVFGDEKITYWNSLMFFPIALMKVLKINGSGSDNVNLPKWINNGLLKVLWVENWMIKKGLYLPIGVSLLYIGRKL